MSTHHPLTSHLKKLQKHKYLIFVTLILLLAFCLRFYHFDVRWGIGNDDARDVAIAQEAIRRGEVPMIGSFSSAGPFVFGPFFYWFLIGSYLLVPFIFTIPWIFMGLIGVATVGLFILCGRLIAGKNFSLLLGLLAATSPQLVSRSLTLGQHTFVAFTTVSMLLFLLLLFKRKKLRYAFLTGLFIGAAINFHYQALNLLIFLPLLLFVQPKNFRFIIFSLILAMSGVLLSLSPLIVWDAQQHFANFRNLFDYLLIGQQRIYVPNSWTLFVFTYLPNYWAYVISGSQTIALLSMIFTGSMILFASLKKKLPYPLFLLIFPFTFLLILNRYYKGERSEGYLIYFLPFILFFVAYALFLLFKSDFIPKRFLLASKIVSIISIVFLVAANIAYLNNTSFARYSRVALIEEFADHLVAKYPDRKFSLYDYKGLLPYHNQPLSIFLDRRGLIDKEGIPVGICSEKCPGKYPKIATLSGVFIVDLRKEKSLQNPSWINVNPESMYDDLIGWSKRHELTSTFSFVEYIKAKFK